MSLNELYALSAAEKLHIIENLWDRLNDEDVPSPDWHEEVLAKRKEQYDNGELTLMSLEEFKQQSR